jgi:hypothetical protein
VNPAEPAPSAERKQRRRSQNIDAQDDEGRDLPDVDAVFAEAVREARALIKTSIDDTGRIDLRHHIDVRDERGNTAFAIHLEDPVTVQRVDEILSRASLGLAGSG